MRQSSDLREMSKHLYYELIMLQGTTVHLAKKRHPFGTIEHNALLESFLIHSRSLIDFLYVKGQYEDDLLAAHFFNNPVEWEKIRPVLPDFLKQTKERTHKKLAHLTFTRLEDKEGWEFIRIRKEIYKVFREFFKKVPDDLLCGELKKFKSKIMRMKLDS